MSRVIPVLLILSLGAVVYAKWRPHAAVVEAVPRPIGAPGGATTTREGLTQSIAALEAMVAQRPGDPVLAVRLAESLLRQTRVGSNPGLAVRAEEALKVGLAAAPGHYEAIAHDGDRAALAAPVPRSHPVCRACPEGQPTRHLESGCPR